MEEDTSKNESDKKIHFIIFYVAHTKSTQLANKREYVFLENSSLDWLIYMIGMTMIK